MVIYYSHGCYLLDEGLMLLPPWFIQEIGRTYFVSLPHFSRLLNLFLIVRLMTGINLGGPEISEADSDDISVWCHLHWCS